MNFGLRVCVCVWVCEGSVSVWLGVIWHFYFDISSWYSKAWETEYALKLKELTFAIPSHHCFTMMFILSILELKCVMLFGTCACWFNLVFHSLFCAAPPQVYIGLTDHLWEKHCQRDFRGAQLQEYESWREMFSRLSEERERKLASLTKSIVSAHSQRPKGAWNALASHFLPFFFFNDLLFVFIGYHCSSPRKGI